MIKLLLVEDDPNLCYIVQSGLQELIGGYEVYTASNGKEGLEVWKKHRPDIIAATNWLFNHEQLLHIISRAKALLPHCCIVLGGPEFLGNNEAFLRKNKFVNGVFRGEGEEVFPIWLKVWNHPVNEWNQISGLCYLDESDQYQDNGIARVMNFSQLVSPEKTRCFN